MKYELNINQHNIKPHLDIEQDIQQIKDGLFTFNLKVSQGNIEDYARYNTITIHEYREFGFSVVEEQITTFDSRTGSTENAIRPTNR